MKVKNFLLIILAFVFVSMAPPKVKILMAGDSTMADKPLTKHLTDTLTGETFDEPLLERGWGQLLPEFVNDKAVVVNYAKNGRSTRTFIEEGLWTELIKNVRKGDIVIIQFGHNDEVETKKSYTKPEQFRLNFIAFVNDVRAKGGNPILCTAVARRSFDEKGNLLPTHGEYPSYIRQVAAEQKVPLIDMEKLTSEWLQKEGVENSRKYFHKIPPGVSRVYPKGLDDNTHFNEAGARQVAKMFVSQVKDKKIKPLTKLIK
ncbi:MAG: rhgT [Bacteroidetes bacterium]|nr:rhgT [Bacteroidota bacterium]